MIRTKAELEAERDRLAKEFTPPYKGNILDESFIAGFAACFAIMLKREKCLRETALKEFKEYAVMCSVECEGNNKLFEQALSAVPELK